MEAPVAGYRRHVQEFLAFALGRRGRTIPAMGLARDGDAAQLRHANRPVWHRRIEIIEYLAREMRISPRHRGPERTSPDFYNAVDQEIAKLRRRGAIADWNRAGRLGVIRIMPGHAVRRRPSMSPPSPAQAGAGAARPVPGDGAMKRAFVSILTRGRKANTYKFALARAMLEYCRDAPLGAGGAHRISYEHLAGKFLEYYWHQECRFRIKQDFRTRGVPKVISAIRGVSGSDAPADFGALDDRMRGEARDRILKTVFGHARSKTSLVVPKFQKIVEGGYASEHKIFYDYDDDEKVLVLKPGAFAFLKDNGPILSGIVLAEWAKFLEKINGSLPRLVAKIEHAGARRESLARFRRAYAGHSDHCFYCCGRLECGLTHVDHLLPWSYVFEDEAWNLVLACRGCNLRKSDSLPQEDFERELIRRNERYRHRIPLLDRSIGMIDTKLGWRREIRNHYSTCKEYGFSVTRMP